MPLTRSNRMLGPAFFMVYQVCAPVTRDWSVWNIGVTQLLSVCRLLRPTLGTRAPRQHPWPTSFFFAFPLQFLVFFVLLNMFVVIVIESYNQTRKVTADDNEARPEWRRCEGWG